MRGLVLASGLVLARVRLLARRLQAHWQFSGQVLDFDALTLDRVLFFLRADLDLDLRFDLDLLLDLDFDLDLHDLLRDRVFLGDRDRDRDLDLDFDLDFDFDLRFVLRDRDLDFNLRDLLRNLLRDLLRERVFLGDRDLDLDFDLAERERVRGFCCRLFLLVADLVLPSVQQSPLSKHSQFSYSLQLSCACDFFLVLDLKSEVQVLSGSLHLFWFVLTVLRILSHGHSMFIQKHSNNSNHY